MTPLTSDPKLMAGGMVQDKESGLILPKELEREKHRAVWLKEDVKFLRRMQRWAEGQELDIIFHCRQCGEYVEWVQGEEGVEVTCDCKRRVAI
jgi:hypothetical protein